VCRQYWLALNLFQAKGMHPYPQTFTLMAAR
jgi:hypothetical protein